MKRFSIALLAPTLEMLILAAIGFGTLLPGCASVPPSEPAPFTEELPSDPPYLDETGEFHGGTI